MYEITYPSYVILFLGRKSNQGVVGKFETTVGIGI